MTSPNTGIPYVPEGTLDPAAGLNIAIDHIDALLQSAVKSMALTTPPGGEVDGDMYIVASPGAGAWLGQTNNLARYVADGAFWRFFVAGATVHLVLNLDDLGLYKFNADSPQSWTLAGGLGDAPSDGERYGRLDGGWVVLERFTVTNLDSPSIMATDVNGLVFGGGFVAEELSGGRVLIELPGSGGSGTDIQTFTANGTWTKPTGTPKVTDAYLVAAGGGGASARKGLASSTRGSGSGGSGGGVSQQRYLTSLLGATEAVVVSAGGAGGAAQTVNSTNGNPGSPGGDTSFGSLLKAVGGLGGNAGTSAGSGALVAGGGGNLATGGAGGSANPVTAAARANIAGGGGGAGGSVSAGNSAIAGGVGADGPNFYAGTLSGGTGGTGGTTGGNGGNGSSHPNTGGGAGGGGGGGNTAAGSSGGNGGAGGTFGAGGGGGGGATDGAGQSGAGGAGGGGVAVIITFY